MWAGTNLHNVQKIKHNLNILHILGDFESFGTVFDDFRGFGVAFISGKDQTVPKYPKVSETIPNNQIVLDCAQTSKTVP